MFQHLGLNPKLLQDQSSLCCAFLGEKENGYVLKTVSNRVLARNGEIGRANAHPVCILIVPKIAEFFPVFADYCPCFATVARAKHGCTGGWLIHWLEICSSHTLWQVTIEYLVIFFFFFFFFFFFYKALHHVLSISWTQPAVQKRP